MCFVKQIKWLQQICAQFAERSNIHFKPRRKPSITLRGYRFRIPKHKKGFMFSSACSERNLKFRNHKIFPTHGALENGRSIFDRRAKMLLFQNKTRSRSTYAGWSFPFALIYCEVQLSTQEFSYALWTGWRYLNSRALFAILPLSFNLLHYILDNCVNIFCGKLKFSGSDKFRPSIIYCLKSSSA